MRFILDILKGCVMGIANVIPGVSGGTMAVSMGIYDRLIHALTHIFKEFKKSVISVLPIFIGMGIGIVGLSMIVEWMFGTIPIQTNLLFIGLILGGFPIVWSKFSSASVKPWHLLGYTLFFMLVVVLALFNDAQGAAADVSFSLINCLKLCGAGIVAAATMVIPGVSGSMMLMLLGYYESVISAVSQIVKSIPAGDFETFKACAFILVPFGVGVLIGIVVIAKIVDMLLTKCKVMTFWCIAGLLAGSPIAIIIVNKEAFKAINATSALTGIVALLVGIFIALILGREPGKK